MEHQLDLKRLTGKIAVISMAVGALGAFQSCGLPSDRRPAEAVEAVEAVVEEEEIIEEQDCTVIAPSENSTNTIDMPVDGK